MASATAVSPRVTRARATPVLATACAVAVATDVVPLALQGDDLLFAAAWNADAVITWMLAESAPGVA